MSNEVAYDSKALKSVWGNHSDKSPVYQAQKDSRFSAEHIVANPPTITVDPKAQLRKECIAFVEGEQFKSNFQMEWDHIRKTHFVGADFGTMKTKSIFTNSAFGVNSKTRNHNEKMFRMTIKALITRHIKTASLEFEKSDQSNEPTISFVVTYNDVGETASGVKQHQLTICLVKKQTGMFALKTAYPSG